MAELHDLTALEQGELLQRCEISPGELAEHYLNRIDKLDDVGAFVTIAEERISSCARELSIKPVGASPLWGVPTAIKDLNVTKGVRTTFGSKAFEDYVPDVSDEVTLAIEAAGMISLGKTNTPEFGSPCYTEPDVAPPAVTPWDRTRMAGGSSGGAGAAVAAGLVPLAQGSDGGGSIRIPASCCGLVGLKPSRGRISSGPAYGDPTGLATAGPIARTVRDAAALLDVLAGHRPGDPYWAPEPVGTFLEACDRPPGRLRIARFIEPLFVEADVHPECRQAWEDASRLLESLGHEVVDIPRPLAPELGKTFSPLWTVLTALSTSRVSEERRDLLRPLTRWLGEKGERVSGVEFGLALAEARRYGADGLRTLAAYDAVLTPTLASPPLPVGALRNDEEPWNDFHAQGEFTPWTSAWNLTGMPAISLPLHWTPEGLPVGVMLAGRPAEEELLLSLAAQIEEAAPWADRKPPGWSS